MSRVGDWAPFNNSPEGGSGEATAWPNLCWRISQMSRLQHLWCTLHKIGDFEHEQETSLLKQLSVITQPRVFHVILKGSNFSASLESEHEYPFEIFRQDFTYLV